MREIKFRGKRKDKGVWEYGDLITKPIHHECVILENGVINHSIDPATVGQFTGLKDKNGKEIYEGDIIKLVNADGATIHVVCEYGTAQRAIVTMDGNSVVDITGFYFKLPNGRKTFPIVKNYAGEHDLELFEVVGNIYENPELPPQIDY